MLKNFGLAPPEYPPGIAVAEAFWNLTQNASMKKVAGRRSRDGE